MNAWQEIGLSYLVLFLVSLGLFPVFIRIISCNLRQNLDRMGLRPISDEPMDAIQLYSYLREQAQQSLPVHLAQLGPKWINIYYHHFLVVSLPEDINGQLIIQEYDAGWGAKFGALLWGRVQLEHLTVEKLLFKTRPLGKFFDVRHEEGISGQRIRYRLEQRHGEPFWRSTFNNCEHYAQWIMTGKHRSAQMTYASPFLRFFAHGLISRVVYILAHLQFVFAILFRLAFTVLAPLLSSKEDFRVMHSDFITFLAIMSGELIILVWELSIIAYISGKHCCPSIIRYCYAFSKQKWRVSPITTNLNLIDEENSQGASATYLEMQATNEIYKKSGSSLSDKLHRHPHSALFSIAVVQKILIALLMTAFTSFGAFYGHIRWAPEIGHSGIAEVFGGLILALINLGYIYPLFMTLIEHTFYVWDNEKIGNITIGSIGISLAIAMGAFIGALLGCLDCVYDEFPWIHCGNFRRNNNDTLRFLH